MEKVRIEGMDEGGRMGPAREILQTQGIALVAVGSPACVRSLYFVAEELGRTGHFFWKALSARDYSLGRHEKAIRECVQEALARPSVRGVIIYASCLDILACLDLGEILAGILNPREIPVEILYRGPLAKRRELPMEALERVWKRWGVWPKGDLAAKGGRTSGQDTEKNSFQREPPKEPEFEKIIEALEKEDGDILLLTPGGCKSCMTFQKREVFKRVKNTRFSDIGVCSGNVEELVKLVLEAFPLERPLNILGTAVMDAVGFDYEGLCSQLREQGKEAVFLSGGLKK